MQPLKRVGIGVIAFVVIVSVFAGGFYAGRTQLLRVEDKIVVAGGLFTPSDIDLRSFWKVWEELDENFVGTNKENTPSIEERVFGAIEGLTNSFGDPYTVFLPPAESALFEEDITGNFGGVGMEIGIQDEVLTVISPLRNTPAERAGIRAGDAIVAIDEISTFGMGVDEAVLRIRGDVGSPVHLSVVRENVDEILDINVVREIITIPTLETIKREDGIFIIQLYNFGLSSPNEFRSAIREFIVSGSRKLILDLRGNPGGFLQASVDVASWFLPAGKIVVSEEGGKESRIHRSRGYDVFNETLEMVILVDGGSASASEIVAGALRDHGIATLVGTQTFGKGSVQELLEVGSDSTLRLTVAHWLTPSKESISEDGLTPDIVIEFTEDDIAQGRDPQLEKAIELLNKI